MYAAALTDMFDEPGTLTLGQVSPTVTAGISTGDYNGYIDEVRVWSRTHNPTVITENFRVTVTDSTADVTHNWNFNEGVGMTAYEKISKQNMVPVSVAEAPKWVKSTLDLSQKHELDSPKMTQTDETNAEVLAEAQSMCSNLIGEFSLNAVHSDMDTLMTVYEALCVQEMVSSNDTEQVAAVLASMADLYTTLTNTTDSPIQSLCNVVQSLSNYIGAGGDQCQSCNFGDFDDNGDCVCLDSHWGASCDDICPVADLGACNHHGVCNMASGYCDCHPRHYAGDSTVEDFWKAHLAGNSTAVANAQYACNNCSGDWVGKSCEFAKSEPVSQSTGMAYGSYVTTFDGLSMALSTPGTYTLSNSGDVEVQALFLPCPGDHTCRLLTELAMASGSSSVHIQHAPDGGNVTVIIKEDGAVTDSLLFPTEQSFGPVSVKWTVEPYIEISSGGSSFIAYDTPIGLVTNAKVSGSGSNTGVFGNTADGWLESVKCPNTASELAADDVTIKYAGDCIREKYMSAASFIDNKYANDSLTSAGYSLLLSGGTDFTATGLTVEQGVTDVTFGVWVNHQSTSLRRSVNSFTIATIDVGTTDIVLRVDGGQVVVDWGSTYTTGIDFLADTWQYLSFTWATDGLAAVYLIGDDTVQSKDPLDGLLHAGSTVNLQSIAMTSSSSDNLLVDCFRSWKTRKSLSEADDDSTTYCGITSATDTNLMLSIPFDDGNGTTLTVYSYDTDENAVPGTIVATTNATIANIPVDGK